MRVPELLKAAIIGIIEGITEWLPISSTGHMILFNELITLNVSKAFWEVFLVVIQLGAICAVPFVFRERIFPSEEKGAFPRALWLKVALATVPAAFAGLAFEIFEIDRVVDNHYVVATALVVYGVVFLLLSHLKQGRNAEKKRIEDITYSDALKLGAFQILSLVPGTSRSGSVLVGGEMLEISTSASAEFSFLMAIPIMLGASLLKVLVFFASGVIISQFEIMLLLLGMAVSFVVSIASMRFLVDFVRHHTLSSFGIYRIILGAIVILYFIINK